MQAIPLKVDGSPKSDCTPAQLNAFRAAIEKTERAHRDVVIVFRRDSAAHVWRSWVEVKVESGNPSADLHACSTALTTLRHNTSAALHHLID